MHLGNLKHIHCRSTASEIYAKNTKDEQSRTSHQHQRKFHCRILLVAAAPDSDKKIHRDKCNLIEHEHGEHVGCDEETVHTSAQKSEPKEILLGERLKLP